MPNAYRLFVDRQNGKLLRAPDSYQMASIQEMIRASDDSQIPLELIPLDAVEGGGYEAASYAIDDVRLVIGNPSEVPTGGTFELVHSGNNSEAINVEHLNADVIERALNNIASIDSAGGVQVTRNAQGYVAQAITNGALGAITADEVSLVPHGTVSIVELQAGSATTKGAYQINLKADPYALLTTWSSLSAASIALNTIKAGSSSQYETQQIAITGAVRGGYFTISDGSSVTSALNYDASAADVEDAINGILGANTVTVEKPNSRAWDVRWATVGDKTALTVDGAITSWSGLSGTLQLNTTSLAASIAGKGSIQAVAQIVETITSSNEKLIYSEELELEEELVSNATLMTIAANLLPSLRGTATFTAATRAAEVPDYEGQIGVETDTGLIYRSTGTSAGNWVQIVPGSEIHWDQTNGDDDNSGRSSGAKVQSWATVQSILSNTIKPATVYIYGDVGYATGTLPDQAVMNDARYDNVQFIGVGNDARWIVASKLANFSNNAGIWEQTITWEPHWMMSANQWAQPARFPDKGSFIRPTAVYTTGDVATTSNVPIRYVEFDKSDLTTSPTAGDILVIHTYWLQIRHEITAVADTGSTYKLTIDDTAYGMYSGGVYSRCYIEGRTTEAYLTAEGEFWVEDAGGGNYTVKYKPRTGETINVTEVWATRGVDDYTTIDSRKDYSSVILDGRSNVTFRNVEFALGAWYHPTNGFDSSNNSGGLRLNNNQATGIVTVIDSDDVTFERCHFRFGVMYGVSASDGSDRCKIKKCQVSESSGGVKLGDSANGTAAGTTTDCNACSVANTYIYNTGQNSPFCSGYGILLGKGVGNAAIENEIYKIESDAIMFNQAFVSTGTHARGAIVRGNYCHDLCTQELLIDIGVIHSVGDQGDSTPAIIEGNTIADGSTYATCIAALYADQDTGNVIFRNNYIHSIGAYTKSILVNTGCNSTLVFENNVFSCDTMTGIRQFTLYQDADLLTLRNNVFVLTRHQGEGNTNNRFIADPSSGSTDWTKLRLDGNMWVDFTVNSTPSVGVYGPIMFNSLNWLATWRHYETGRLIDAAFLDAGSGISGTTTAATDNIAATSHGLASMDYVYFSAVGASETTVEIGVTYRIKSVDANTINIYDTDGQLVTPDDSDSVTFHHITPQTPNFIGEWGFNNDVTKWFRSYGTSAGEWLYIKTKDVGPTVAAEAFGYGVPPLPVVNVFE